MQSPLEKSRNHIENASKEDTNLISGSRAHNLTSLRKSNKRHNTLENKHALKKVQSSYSKKIIGEDGTSITGVSCNKLKPSTSEH